MEGRWSHVPDIKFIMKYEKLHGEIFVQSYLALAEIRCNTRFLAIGKHLSLG